MPEKRNQRAALDEEKAMKLAEATDVSPRQARLLIERYGDDEKRLMEAARNFKAEG
ncbi:MAG TPA: hypothetical protein VNS02_05230 [Rhizobiaceae bacterium]|nr:hypothetical protein [Rhizobiaceae bacterium]